MGYAIPKSRWTEGAKKLHAWATGHGAANVESIAEMFASAFARGGLAWAKIAASPFATYSDANTPSFTYGDMGKGRRIVAAADVLFWLAALGHFGLPAASLLACAEEAEPGVAWEIGADAIEQAGDREKAEGLRAAIARCQVTN